MSIPKQPTRLPLYLKARDRAILEPAARRAGETLSAFVRHAALAAARQVLGAKEEVTE